MNMQFTNEETESLAKVGVSSEFRTVRAGLERFLLKLRVESDILMDETELRQSQGRRQAIDGILKNIDDSIARMRKAGQPPKSAGPLEL